MLSKDDPSSVALRLRSDVRCSSPRLRPRRSRLRGRDVLVPSSRPPGQGVNARAQAGIVRLARIGAAVGGLQRPLQGEVLGLQSIQPVGRGAIGGAVLLHLETVAQVEALLPVALGFELPATDDQLLLEARDRRLCGFVVGEAGDQRRCAGAVTFALLRETGMLGGRRLGIAAQLLDAAGRRGEIATQRGALRTVLGDGGGEQRDLVGLRLVELADGLDLLCEPRRLDALRPMEIMSASLPARTRPISSSRRSRSTACRARRWSRSDRISCMERGTCNWSACARAAAPGSRTPARTGAPAGPSRCTRVRSRWPARSRPRTPCRPHGSMPRGSRAAKSGAFSPQKGFQVWCGVNLR